MPETTPQSQLRTNKRKNLIARLVERDGKSCGWCGDLLGEEINITKIIPSDRGGNRQALNCVLACTECNQQRSGSPVGCWYWELVNQGKHPNQEFLKTRLTEIINEAEGKGLRKAADRELRLLMGEPPEKVIRKLKSRYTRIAKIFMRDGYEGCIWCGRELRAAHPLTTYEHLIPRAKGGGDSLNNLAAACKACNHERATTPVAEWVIWCEWQGRRVNREAIEKLLKSLCEEELHAPQAARELQYLKLQNLGRPLGASRKAKWVANWVSA